MLKRFSDPGYPILAQNVTGCPGMRSWEPIFLPIKMRLILLLGPWILSLLSCHTPVGIQSPEPLDRGKWAFNAGAQVIGTRIPDNDLSLKERRGPALITHLGVRYGIADGLDAGMDLNSSGASLWDVKLRLLGTKDSRMAFGMGAGLQHGLLFSDQPQRQWYLPVYISLRIGPNSACFVSPRILYGWRGRNEFSPRYEIEYLDQTGLALGLDGNTGHLHWTLGVQYLASRSGVPGNPYRSIWQWGVLLRPR